VTVGFPPRAQFTAVPALLVSRYLPQMNDVAEVKACLFFFWKLGQKRGWPRSVALHELLSDPAAGAGWTGEPAVELKRGLALAEGRGILFHRTLERSGSQEELYFVNTEADRRAAGGVGAEAVGPVPVHSEPAVERPDIFALYEQNIGLLTPMVAEELVEAEKLYPFSWIEEAFKEAVSLNKRSWRYIQRILERWAVEGRESGETGRHPEADKYFRGKYGHIVRR